MRFAKAAFDANALVTLRRHDGAMTQSQAAYDHSETIANRPARNPIDPDTGLLTRHEFLQRAGAEFRRAKRYGRDLAVCVITPLRPNLPGRAFADLAMLLEESSRYGIDMLGRTGERQFSVLLPETGLIGAMDFSARMRQALERNTRITLPDFSAREAICLPDDQTVAELLARCG